MNETIRQINIWDSKQKDKCIFIKSYEELIKYIKENNILNLTIHETHNPNDPIKCIFDDLAERNNISLTYTDNEHPITVLYWPSLEHNILINPSFFNEHKQELKEEIKKIILEKIKEKNFSIRIPDILIDDEFIDFICSSDELSETYISFYEFSGEKLTEEQINKIKQAHLEVRENGNSISTKKIIGYNTIKNLAQATSLSLDDDLSNEEVENFIYINNDCIITINKPYNNNDELEYLKNLSRIFQILSKHNKNYNIKIEINNRELLKQSGILNYNNINLTINNDLYEYQKEEFLNEESQLDKLIKPIKEANLSPYEKYLAVYNIVKNFKPYKENDENKEEARYLRYILNNEYMVCVGYAKLLTTLLDKVGIPSMQISVGVDTSYDDGFTKEAKPTEIAGHARNIIKIDDDKYGIHGIFVADATWDNDLENDLYNNSAMTFNRKKEATRLETLKDEDLLLDFNNLNDFSQKINFFLKRKINHPIINEPKHNKRVIKAYKNLYQEITKILSILDYPKYKELHTKYNELIENKINAFELNKVSLKEIEEIFGDFLTEYATYIIPLSNQKIDNNTLLNAAINTKKEIDKYSKEELEELRDKIKKVNEERNSAKFPYIYDPNNKVPNYLESVEETSKKR